jgi:hypothetical protein
MEPRERERHRWATRTGELSGESESMDRRAELAGPGFNSTVKIRRPKSFPRIYRKQLTMHKIKRVAEESTSGSEDSQRAIAATNKLSQRLSTLPGAVFEVLSHKSVKI